MATDKAQLVHPTGEGDQHEPEWIQESRHSFVHYHRCPRWAGKSKRIQADPISGPNELYASIIGADDDFLYSVHSYHMRFHLRIAEIGGNVLLRDAIEREQVLIFNWLFDTAAQQQRILPSNFHSELAAALTGGTVAVADAAMRDHVRYGMDHVLDALSQTDNGNGWRLPRKGSAGGIMAGKPHHR